MFLIFDSSLDGVYIKSKPLTKEGVLTIENQMKVII